MITDEELVRLFYSLVLKLIDAGFSNEIAWQRNLKPCDNAQIFLYETCWVILNAGMKEQIARKIWQRIQIAWKNNIDILEVFKHKGKVNAINFLKNNYKLLFKKYLKAENKIEYLKTLPYIGNITCYHLAKNLGYDCFKPDRHIVRIANKYNLTPEKFCKKISNLTKEKISVIDIVFWRSANLKLI